MGTVDSSRGCCWQRFQNGRKCWIRCGIVRRDKPTSPITLVLVTLVTFNTSDDIKRDNILCSDDVFKGFLELVTNAFRKAPFQRNLWIIYQQQRINLDISLATFYLCWWCNSAVPNPSGSCCCAWPLRNHYTFAICVSNVPCCCSTSNCWRRSCNTSGCKLQTTPIRSVLLCLCSLLFSTKQTNKYNRTIHFDIFANVGVRLLWKTELKSPFFCRSCTLM